MFANIFSLFRPKSRQEAFRAQVSDEIYGRLFPHLQGEECHDYPFASDKEMEVHTESLNVQESLEALELQIQRLPESYGRCFRYIVHRDLKERLHKYGALAQKKEMPPSLEEIPLAATA